MKKVCVILVLILTCPTLFSAEKFTTADLPKKSILVSQDTIGNVYPVIYIVDLDTRELIIVGYFQSGKIDYIIHTGVTIDVDQQLHVEVEAKRN